MGVPSHPAVPPGSGPTPRWSLAAVALLAACRADASPVDYAREVKPLPRGRCYACHGALKQKAFAKLKGLAQKAAERTAEGVWTVVRSLARRLRPTECRNSIRHSGYAATIT
ncbi:hypothetical protein J0H58_25370 [bacterium]|nr:hypothetical protein [bacterium]